MPVHPVRNARQAILQTRFMPQARPRVVPPCAAQPWSEICRSNSRSGRQGSDFAVEASYVTIWAAILRMGKIRNLARGFHPTHAPTVQADVFERRLGLTGPVFIPVIFFLVWLAIPIRRWLL